MTEQASGDLSPTAAEDQLRDVRAITDAELSRLDAEDFLSQLVDRVKAIMRADTAAVLLLDRSGTQLVATAASGLEEEVRQGVRIPVGRGFAGRIAAERRPVIIDHVDYTTVVNPILIAKGIRTMIGAPLLAGGTVLGVLHVGSLGSRTFASDDAALLQLAAERAAVAVQFLRSRSDRTAATALAHSLLPETLPEIPGLEMAARYIPGYGDVGGDWYDVFTLPSGELCAVMGDVAGAGLQAAVTMGRLRSALRAYSLESRDPADVLSRLDANVQTFEPGTIATVLYAVFDPDLEHVRISSAGHLLPVVVLPGNSPELAAIQGDLLIGASANFRRHTTTLWFPPGSLLCLYTDGLVERRGETLDDGLDALRAAITAGPADGVCVSVMAALVGNTPATDDLTMLVFRRLPPGLSAAATG
jgi:putative methionine-R-sulfoxide reductase with GAF domain